MGMNKADFKLSQAASLVYPVIICQLMGEIGEAKAAEMLDRNIEAYKDLKINIVRAVMDLIDTLPNPVNLVLNMKG